ncbi:MAG: hypothetical protein MJZ68_09555, partial [archaeon]|nr:hypothetical protein [archaeon]
MYNLEHELDKGITSLAIEGVSVDKSEKEFTKSFLEHNLDSDDLIRELTKYYKSYALGIDPSIMDSLLEAYLDLVNWDCINNLKKDITGKNEQD